MDEKTNNIIGNEKQEDNNHQEDIETYILSQFNKEVDDNIKEKLIQSWKDNKAHLMEHKIKQLHQLQEEKKVIEGKDKNMVIKDKRKFEHMETYVDHCLKQVQNKIKDSISDINNHNKQWNPNDIQLVQAVVSANRHAFKEVMEEEYVFQENIKKQKVNNINTNNNLDDAKSIQEKVIHARKWNVNIHVNTIGSHIMEVNDNTFHPFVRPIEKTLLHI